MQGESTYAGRPCVFVRLTACDLRCSWCDTPYAFHEGTQAVARRGAGRGGPLRLPAGRGDRRRAAAAGGRLSADGRRCSTAARRCCSRPAATAAPSACPTGVVTILDVKCPGSGEAHRMDWEQPRPAAAARRGEVRHQGSRRLRVRARRHRAATTWPARAAAVHFSPVHGVLDLRQLSEWVLADRLPVRVSCSCTSTSGTRPREASERRRRPALSGGLDSYTAAAIARAEGLRAARADRALRPAARAGARGGPRAWPRALGVARHVELDVDLSTFGGSSLTSDAAGAEGPRRSTATRSRPPTCRRATRCSCRWRSAGPRCSAPATSSSASTRSTTPAIPTAGRSSSPRSSELASLATAAGVGGARFRVHTPLIDADQGARSSGAAWRSASTTA